MDDKNRASHQSGKPQQTERNKDWNPEGSAGKEGQHAPKGVQEKPSDPNPQRQGGPSISRETDGEATTERLERL